MLTVPLSVENILRMTCSDVGILRKVYYAQLVQQHLHLLNIKYWSQLLIFASFAYTEDMHFGYSNLQSGPCITYCATSKTGEF